MAAPSPAPGSGGFDLLDTQIHTGTLTSARVGHSRATADSSATPRERAESANLDASVLFYSAAQRLRDLAPAGRRAAEPGRHPGRHPGLRAGDRRACVGAVNGVQQLSRSTTPLASAHVVDSTVPGLGYLARIGASQIATGSALEPTGSGTADVVANTTATIGDIGLVGGAATVHVSSPVVLQAFSDGTTGTAALLNTPTVTVVVGSTTIPIPLNGTPDNVPISIPSNPLLGVSLNVTGCQPTSDWSGALGSASLDDLVRVSLTVTLASVTVATLSLGTAPMSVSAQAPAGGVICATDPSNDTDGDGLTDVREGQLGTDPTKADTDGDGLSDGAEVDTYGTNPLLVDTDGDGLSDGTEVGTTHTDPKVADTDGDGLADGAEVNTYRTDPLRADTDGDGLPDGNEVGTRHTNPTAVDTDGGGVPDGTGVARGTNPLNAADDDSTAADTDGDGLPDNQEMSLGTNPAKADTDGDGLEVHGLPGTGCATNPKSADTNGDGLGDGTEYAGITIAHKLFTTKSKQGHLLGLVKTNPCGADTDGDGLTDGQEVAGVAARQKVRSKSGKYTLTLLISNPTVKDSDGDGLTDLQEDTGSANKRFSKHRTDPLNYDTDGGGVGDGREIKHGADPTNVKSSPPRSRTHHGHGGHSGHHGH